MFWRAEEEEEVDADEGIALTDQEREALAGLAESIGDPWLAGQLAGRGPAPARRRPRPAWLRAAPGWVGLLLAVAGAALAVMTFIHSTVVASLGLIVMGVGLWRVVVDSGDGIVRRLTARRSETAAPPYRRDAAA